METQVPFVLHISKDGCCGFMTKQTEQGCSNSAAGIELLDENLKKEMLSHQSAARHPSDCQRKLQT